MLRDISLQIAEGEFLTILGESGSGKTTLLRIIAGFESANSGEILMEGERLDLLPPYRRRVNTVFQHYALFPHLTVEENVGYGLRVAKLPKNEIATRVSEALAMVKMTAFASSKPAKISGGQQQRIALARALVNRPRLVVAGRTAVGAGRQSSPANASGAEIAATRGRYFVRLRHPRPGRSHGHVGPHCASAHGRTGAGGVTARDLQPSGNRVHGTVYRPHQSASRRNQSGSRSLQRRSRGESACRRAPALFSLRPENIRIVNPETGPDVDVVSFRGRIQHQAFHGATELLQVVCDDGLALSVRTATRENWQGELHLEFSPTDAVLVRESPERG